MSTSPESGSLFTVTSEHIMPPAPRQIGDIVESVAMLLADHRTTETIQTRYAGKSSKLKYVVDAERIYGVDPELPDAKVGASIEYGDKDGVNLRIDSDEVAGNRAMVNGESIYDPSTIRFIGHTAFKYILEDLRRIADPRIGKEPEFWQGYHKLAGNVELILRGAPLIPIVRPTENVLTDSFFENLTEVAEVAIQNTEKCSVTNTRSRTIQADNRLITMSTVKKTGMQASLATQHAISVTWLDARDNDGETPVSKLILGVDSAAIEGLRAFKSDSGKASQGDLRDYQAILDSL